MVKKGLGKYSNLFAFVFRVMVGLLFAQHGAQKLFGMFGGQAATFGSMFFFAGLIEFFGGLFIALGFITRLAASISALEMLIAYFMAHASKGLMPIQNGGELALVYFAAFLILIACGGGKLTLDKVFFKKELL